MEITLYRGDNWPLYDYAVESMFPDADDFFYHKVDDTKDSDWDYLKVSIKSPMTRQQREYLEYLLKWRIISNYMVSATYIGIIE